MPDWKNKLFFGDNLRILREHVADESVDLVYLDPPFNSNANYNVLFKENAASIHTLRSPLLRTHGSGVQKRRKRTSRRSKKAGDSPISFRRSELFLGRPT